jgi:hypothetical protein
MAVSFIVGENRSTQRKPLTCPKSLTDGEIFATINQKDGMVRFHDNPEQYKSASMLQQLDKEVI